MRLCHGGQLQQGSICARSVAGAHTCNSTRTRRAAGAHNHNSTCARRAAGARRFSHACHVAHTHYVRNQVQIGGMKGRQLFIITSSFCHPQSSENATAVELFDNLSD
jgi:GTP-dependent phosphoenolpyruvate carboxykinase